MNAIEIVLNAGSVNECRYMLREAIGDLADKLDPRQSILVHQSPIVNLDQVREIYRDGQAESSVVLKDGQRLKMRKAGGQKLAELEKAECLRVVNASR